MAFLTFKGDIIGINKTQIDYISNFLHERGFNCGIVLIKTEYENNFVTIKRLFLGRDGVVSNVLAKIATNDEINRNRTNIKHLFHNEIVMYTKVLPTFAELEKEANVKDDEKLKYATYYGSFCEPPHEVILFEVLSDSTFVAQHLSQQCETLTNEGIKSLLNKLAQFHSLSYILKYKDMDTFKNYKSKLVNIWALMNDMDEIRQSFCQLENEVMEIIDSKHHKDVIRGLIAEFPKFAEENYRTDNRSDFSVILQGGTWNDNVMFQMKNTTSVTFCSTNYQHTRPGSPAFDVLYTIFISTDFSTRSKYYKDWIKYYYSELDKHLRYVELNIERFYPRPQFDVDLKRCSKEVFGQAILSISNLIRESSEVITIFGSADKYNINIDKTKRDKNNIQKCNEIIKSIIESYVLLEYL